MSFKKFESLLAAIGQEEFIRQSMQGNFGEPPGNGRVIHNQDAQVSMGYAHRLLRGWAGAAGARFFRASLSNWMAVGFSSCLSSNSRISRAEMVKSSTGKIWPPALCMGSPMRTPPCLSSRTALLTSSGLLVCPS